MKLVYRIRKFIIYFLNIVVYFELVSCSTNEDLPPIDEYIITNFYERQSQEKDTVSINGVYYELSNPYKNPGMLKLKGSMHNHTNNSAPIDGYGSGEPYRIVEKFRNEGGFDFYAITDHNYVTEKFDIDGIVCMGNSMEDTYYHHLIIYNLPENYTYRFVCDDINKQIEYYHSIGALVSFAHPDWSQQYQPSEKINSVSDVDFVEVFNTIEGGSVRAYNILMSNFPVLAFGTDDYHYQDFWDDPNMYFNKSYIVAFSDNKDKDSIWKSILRGCFYATTGADMDIALIGTRIYVTTSEPSRIEFITPSSEELGLSDVLLRIDGKKFAQYEINGHERNVWVKITNNNGQAISQPFNIKKV